MRRILLSAGCVASGLLLFLLSGSANAQAIPAAGQAAPDFTLAAQDGSSIALSSLRGQWVVVFFYPSTADSGSITEVKAFEADSTEYSKSGSVLGISTDSPALQLKLASAAGATFPLLSDPGGKTAQAYGSLSAKGTANRNTFLIDPKGNVSQVWTGVTPSTASTQVKSTLSLKPPVGSVKPTTMSLKPPVG